MTVYIIHECMEKSKLFFGAEWGRGRVGRERSVWIFDMGVASGARVW